MSDIVSAILNLFGFVDIVTVGDLFTDLFRCVLVVGFVVMFINVIFDLFRNGRRLL